MSKMKGVWEIYKSCQRCERGERGAVEGLKELQEVGEKCDDRCDRGVGEVYERCLKVFKGVGET